MTLNYKEPKMKPYQHRIKAEKKALDQKIAALEEFMTSKTEEKQQTTTHAMTKQKSVETTKVEVGPLATNNVSADEVAELTQQLSLMQRYSGILRKRLERAGTEDEEAKKKKEEDE